MTEWCKVFLDMEMHHLGTRCLVILRSSWVLLLFWQLSCWEVQQCLMKLHFFSRKLVLRVVSYTCFLLSFSHQYQFIVYVCSVAKHRITLLSLFTDSAVSRCALRSALLLWNRQAEGSLYFPRSCADTALAVQLFPLSWGLWDLNQKGTERPFYYNSSAAEGKLGMAVKVLLLTRTGRWTWFDLSLRKL